MATLRYSISVEGQSEELFVVREFDAHESLSSIQISEDVQCHGYRYDVALASRQHTVTAEQIVDKNVELSMFRNGERVRTVHGIVRSFSKGDTGHSYTFYSLVFVPAIERLSLRHNSRTFQQHTAADIISVLLQENGIDNYSFALKRELTQREFCVQYRETDLAFIERLAAEEGLTYSFIHEQGKHTVIFSDASDSLPLLGEPVTYNNISGGIAEDAYICGLTERKQSDVCHSALSDYSFKKPEYLFAQTLSATGDTAVQYEHYDFPGRFKDDETGSAFNDIRLQALRRNSHIALAKGDHQSLQAGLNFTLMDHLNPDMNRHWLVVGLVSRGEQPQALEEEAGAGATTFKSDLTLIPTTNNWQAEPQPKPKVDGPCVATVVGPLGEEIFCDEHGRVKLHFPWDRYSNSDEHSSCWIRVSQGWAGAQYGMMSLPRIGQEVIVSFLNGDPDQPIVTGRSYHAQNRLPYSLPDHKTKTVMRSKTHQGEGFNELSFEDLAGEEQIYLHAQKDLNCAINNDSTTHVFHDHHTLVESNQFKQITVNQHSTTTGESRLAVKGNKVDINHASIQQQVANKYVAQAGREVHLKSGAKVVIEAGAEITLKAGGSFVKVDGSGVHLVGPAINLNAGGSAGQGSGFQGDIAELPGGVESPLPPEVPKTVSYQALLKAEQLGSPAVPVCPLSEES
ncbi:type VI secretion system tip protein VgrG [Vibrio sp. SCSIO 43135]|uniref:type VI secretion system tip protein TssI/VgrG n=1 Tax=Vibrio sp. SCSIO 43135 TaxID=2819096 RepID=UPI002074F24A|nr:type VI secretion system tip protein TssI/VgrG [Vibrio sp. SCSIO 43135]USD40073.1 type VI secretion system tip protein VgrG [Vibrio sp. SCSIO 43135]